MKIEKRFDITISHKFPNGAIASVSLGTKYEFDSILDDASDEERNKFCRRLARRVYNDTVGDLNRAAKHDRLIQEIQEGAKQALVSKDNERESEKILNEDDHKKPRGKKRA